MRVCGGSVHEILFGTRILQVPLKMKIEMTTKMTKMTKMTTKMKTRGARATIFFKRNCDSIFHSQHHQKEKSIPPVNEETL